MRILFAYPAKNKKAKLYPALTEQQCKERLLKYRESLEIQIRLAVTGGMVSERKPSDQRHCLYGIEDWASSGALSSYIVSTLKKVVLNVMDYKNVRGEPISLLRVNARLKDTPPDNNELSGIVNTYMVGYDAEMQEYFSRIESFLK